MAINTKQAERREVSVRSFDELSAELDALERAHAAGTLRHTGNWTPGQVFDHCAIFMGCALDGFPGRLPWPVRVLAKLLFKQGAVSGRTPPAGFGTAPFLVPREGVSFEDGLAAWRTQIARVRGGERFTKPSGLFGNVTHDEWVKMQLGHASLHLSFLHPE